MSVDYKMSSARENSEVTIKCRKDSKICANVIFAESMPC